MLNQGEDVGHDIAHGATLAACLQLVEHLLAMLRRQPPQGGLVDAHPAYARLSVVDGAAHMVSEDRPGELLGLLMT